MTSDNFFPEMGGGQIHVKNVAEQLISLGNEIVLLTNTEGVNDFDQRAKVVRIVWTKKHIIKMFNLLWSLSKDKELIHCHYCYRLALLASVVGRLRRIPVIITLHGMGILNPSLGTPRLYRWAHSVYRYVSLKLCTKVISTSQDLADVACKYISKNKIVVISNGYDPQVFNEKVVVPENLTSKYLGHKIILTVRRLVPKNGIHYLVEAMPYILKQVPEAIFLVIGPGRMTEFIRGRIASLNLTEKIILLGEIPNDKIPEYLKLAEVVVFPSTAESSSIACAEAMAMKKKIVASKIGGLVELLGESGERGTLVTLVDWQGSNYDAPISLPVERYIALADAVVENMKNDDNSRSDKAFDYAKVNLSWEMISKKTEKIYEQTTNRRG